MFSAWNDKMWVCQEYRVTSVYIEIVNIIVAEEAEANMYCL